MCAQYGDNYSGNYDLPAIVVSAPSSSSNGVGSRYGRGSSLEMPSQLPEYPSEVWGALAVAIPISIQQNQRLGLFTSAKGALWSRMTVLQASTKPVMLPTVKTGSLSAKLYSALDASVYLQVPNLMRENRRAYIPIMTKKMKLAQIGSIIEILEGVI